MSVGKECLNPVSDDVRSIPSATSGDRAPGRRWRGLPRLQRGLAAIVPLRERGKDRRHSATARQRIAVLIDAENIWPAAAQSVLAEAELHGGVVIKRAYADWTTARSSTEWRKTLADHAIQPEHLISEQGRNSTDIALTIDAMDMLHDRSIDCLCLVSSDADFSRLAARFQESGITVLGFGARSTRRTMINACSQFFYLEDLPLPGPDLPLPAIRQSPDQLRSNKKLLAALAAALAFTADDEGWSALSVAGPLLAQRSKGFSARTYGFKSLAALLEETGMYVIEKRGNPPTPYARPVDASGNQVALSTKMWWKLLAAMDNTATAEGWSLLDEVEKEVARQLPGFTSRTYGFSSFAAMLKASQLVDVQKTGHKNGAGLRVRAMPALRDVATESLRTITAAVAAAPCDADGWTELGAIGNRLAPTLRAAYLGFKNLREMIEATNRFDLRKAGNDIQIRPRNNAFSDAPTTTPKTSPHEPSTQPVTDRSQSPG